MIFEIFLSFLLDSAFFFNHSSLALLKSFCSDNIFRHFKVFVECSCSFCTNPWSRTAVWYGPLKHWSTTIWNSWKRNRAICQPCLRCCIFFIAFSLIQQFSIGIFQHVGVLIQTNCCNGWVVWTCINTKIVEDRTIYWADTFKVSRWVLVVRGPTTAWDIVISSQQLYHWSRWYFGNRHPIPFEGPQRHCLHQALTLQIVWRSLLVGPYYCPLWLTM